MLIKEESIIDSENKLVDEELALACLLADGICVLSNGKDSQGNNCACVLINTSDCFAFGYADADPITCNGDWKEPSEIIDLYRLWLEDSKWCALKWICLKQKEQPQKAVKDGMIKDGVWDDKLESLAVNEYDIKMKEYWDKKKQEKENKGKENN